jgi:protein-disulfide isomerase
MAHPSQHLAVPVRQHDHRRGPEDAPITLLEYGDFECPYCARAHIIINDLLKSAGREVRFIFRHFPLTQVHPHALLAAQAAEASGVQGRFWDMHDALYENQDALDLDDIIGYAAQLGLDLESFNAALENESIPEHIKSDFRGGVRSGVGGTPSFFINGLKYEGPWDGGALKEALFSKRASLR